MKSLSLVPLCLIILGCSSTEGSSELANLPDTPATRIFHVKYTASVKDLSVGKEVRLWIPIPSDDPHQRISNVEVSTTLPYRFTREPKFGNRMVYIETRASEAELAVTIDYDVDRWVYQTSHEDLQADGRAGSGEAVQMAKYLEPSRLVVVNKQIRELEVKLSQGKVGTYVRARAFAAHILQEMTYGKPPDQPWGRGDTVYACEQCVGNCTDFHSYFISLCRAAKIPARFQIGLFGKYDKNVGKEYKIGGYHCWVEFWVPGKSWVPVDLSEASKILATDHATAAYYFGNHTDNRVTLSTGRDIALVPAQAGELLNYFLNPYVEVDGKHHTRVSKQGYWRDVK